MNKLAIATLTAALLAAPTLGNAAPFKNHATQSTIVHVDWKPGKYKTFGNKKWHGPVMQKTVKKHSVKKSWSYGNKYSNWRSHKPVHDYRSHGLHRPGKGQEWIRVGNDYILVSILSGIIAGAVLGAH